MVDVSWRHFPDVANCEHAGRLLQFTDNVGRHVNRPRLLGLSRPAWVSCPANVNRRCDSWLHVLLCR
jgi:hypothetical protein